MFKHQNKVLALFIVIIISLTIFVLQNQNTPDNPFTFVDVEAWEEDIDRIVSNLRTYHPNPFLHQSESDFNQSILDIKSKLQNFPQDRIILELMSLVAGLKDGHTMIFPLQENTGFQIYPLRLYLFSDGVFITDAFQEYNHLVGAKIIKVNNHNVDDVIEKISTSIPHDNEFTKKAIIPLRLLIPNILSSLSFIFNDNNPNFMLEFSNGTIYNLNLEPINYPIYKDWIFPDRSDLGTIRESFDEITFLTGLPQSSEVEYLNLKDEENFRYFYFNDSKTLYIQYNFMMGITPSGQTITNFANELEEFIDLNEIDQIVVDIRHNPGGDNGTYSSIMDILLDIEENSPSIEIYIALGRDTFSAASNFATEAENLLNATFIGEGMGGSPNLFGNTGLFILPNSGLRMEISGRYFEFSTSDDMRTTISPNVEILLSSVDYFNLIDPVLEFIVNQSL